MSAGWQLQVAWDAWMVCCRCAAQLGCGQAELATISKPVAGCWAADKGMRYCLILNAFRSRITDLCAASAARPACRHGAV
jgi:hypothetical protein